MVNVKKMLKLFNFPSVDEKLLPKRPYVSVVGCNDIRHARLRALNISVVVFFSTKVAFYSKLDALAP